MKSGLVTEILMIERIEYRSRRCYVIHERFVVPVDICDSHGPPEVTSSWLMEPRLHKQDIFGSKGIHQIFDNKRSFR